MSIKVTMVALTSPTSPLAGLPLFDTDFIQPIEWSDQFLVNVPLIDSQHKKLFELIEELRLAHFRKKSGEVVLKTLNGLLSYCMEHFESEELLMRAVGYPLLDSHSEIHRKFTQIARGWHQELKQGTLEVKTVLRTLMDWLIEHVLLNDTKIAEYCRNKDLVVNKLAAVSDIVEILQQNRKWWHEESLFGRILVCLIFPPLLVLAWLSFWNPPNYLHRVVASSIGLVFAILFNAILYVFIRSFQAEQNRRSRVSHAKQLAENLVAGEIASRIAVMDIDDMNNYFSENDGYLLQTMKEIVEHLRSYLPYIPSTLLSLIRGEQDEDEDEDEECEDQGNQKQPNSDRRTSSAPKNDDCCDTGRSQESDIFMKSHRSTVKSFHIATVEFSVKSGGTGKDNVCIEDLTVTSQDSSGRITSFSRTSSSVAESQSGGGGGGGHSGNPTARSARSARGKPSARNGSETGRALKAKLDMLERWIQKKFVTMMSTSIVDFPELLLSKPSEEVLEFHSKYIGVLEAVCKSTKAVFGTMTGDRVVLSWNSANSVGNHAEQACNAALKIRDGFREIYHHTHKLSIAISSGQMQIGNMGSKTKLGFSILGSIPLFVDALCELNGILQTEILVTSQTWRDVRDMFVGKVVAPIDIAKPDTKSPTPGGVSTRSSVTFVSPITSTHQTHSVSPSSATRTLAIELKGTAKREVDEWMYAIQDAEKNDPFAKYNEIVYKLLYGESDYSAAKTQLQEYLKLHSSDFQANQILSMSETFDTLAMSRVAWKTGWVLW